MSQSPTLPVERRFPLPTHCGATLWCPRDDTPQDGQSGHHEVSLSQRGSSRDDWWKAGSCKRASTFRVFKISLGVMTLFTVSFVVLGAFTLAYRGVAGYISWCLASSCRGVIPWWVFSQQQESTVPSTRFREGTATSRG